MASILVVEDHSDSRAMLVTLLGFQQHQLLEAAHGIEALALVQEHHPDLVITDLLMPEMDGFELAQQLRADPTTANTRVVFYTAHYPESAVTTLADACGVHQLLFKPSDPEVILDTVNAALQELEVSYTVSFEDFNRAHRRLLINALLHSMETIERELAVQKPGQPAGVDNASPPHPEDASRQTLTPRQHEVLQLIVEGHSTQEIAHKLFVSVKTVETHRAHLMDRLDIHNVASLVRYAIRQGLFKTDS